VFYVELFFRADVEIRTTVSHIGTKSFTLYHEAWQEGRLCVKETVPIPPDKRKQLEELLDPAV
jgi:acyl-CoA thioester hydrolase